MEKHKITFSPSGNSGYFEEGITIRDAALELGIVIEASCAGMGTCGECKVQVQKSDQPLTESEETLLTPEEIQSGIRLSCQLRIRQSLEVTIPEETEAVDTRIETEGQPGGYPLNPDTRRISLQVPTPELDAKYFDLEMVLQAIEETTEPVSPPPVSVIKELPEILRSNDFQISALLDEDELITVEPPDTSTIYGIVFDIGTTTLVAKLVDLTTGTIRAVESRLNPQREHGADVVSRIRYVMDHARGLERLRQSVVNAMNQMIENLSREAEIPITEIYKAVVVGNTTMEHLCLGVDPTYLAQAPYSPVFQGPLRVGATNIQLEIHPRGIVYLMPNLAGFVGGDITAALTVLNIPEQEAPSILVDIGTNGEVALILDGRVVCASSPAGPAWEGAKISRGMSAAPGAIERAEIENGTLHFQTIGNSLPNGICGSGLLDLTAAFRRSGLIDATGRIPDSSELSGAVSHELAERVRPAGNGTNSIYIADDIHNRELRLTQRDIREVQLAKSAIATGVEVLLRTEELSPDDLHNVYISGGFGNHIHGEDAVGIGLLPPVPSTNVRFIGNAAATGAEAVLLSREARHFAESLAREIEYREVANHPEFQEIYINNMRFPEPIPGLDE